MVCITVLYELIKGITVLYMPNQEHNCTVWLIQYSYVVGYYCMNYTAHFFTLILPRTLPNSTAKGTKSTAKVTNSIAKTCNEFLIAYLIIYELFVIPKIRCYTLPRINILSKLL